MSKNLNKINQEKIPDSDSALMDLAERLSSSNMIPKEYRGKPHETALALFTARELKLSPLLALKFLSMINDRLCIWGDALRAVVIQHPHCEDIIETMDDKSASCTIRRKNKSQQTRTFTYEDAKRAKLLDKAGPWQQYPVRMLQLRAFAWCARDVFADALMGIQTVEEAKEFDYVQNLEKKAEKTASILEKLEIEPTEIIINEE